jgi:hypothetical protein
MDYIYLKKKKNRSATFELRGAKNPIASLVTPIVAIRSHALLCFPIECPMNFV